jgi:hypothetical protein
LQLFIQDLLGRDTAAAKIFRAKADEDYSTMPVVKQWQKIVSAAVLVCWNLFFIYYSILRGYQKGIAWQRAFLMACIAQGLIEIFLNETLECLYIHYFVPRMVSRAEIEKVREVLQSCIRKLCESPSTVLSQHSGQSKVVDAPQYFFVSTNVAKAFPMLMESMMVLSYHSHLPGEICEKWTSSTNYVRTTPITSHNVIGRMVHWITSFISWFVMFMLMNVIATIPLEIQKMIVRFCEPILLGAIAYAMSYALDSVIGLVCIIVVVVVFIMYIAYKTIMNRRNSNRTVPSLATFELKVLKEGIVDNCPEEVVTDCLPDHHSSSSSSSLDESLNESSFYHLPLSHSNSDRMSSISTHKEMHGIVNSSVLTSQPERDVVLEIDSDEHHSMVSDSSCSSESMDDAFEMLEV